MINEKYYNNGLNVVEVGENSVKITGFEEAKKQLTYRVSSNGALFLIPANTNFLAMTDDGLITDRNFIDTIKQLKLPDRIIYIYFNGMYYPTF